MKVVFYSDKRERITISFLWIQPHDIYATHRYGDGKKEKQNEKDLDRMFWECWYSTRIGQESATFTAN